MKRNWDDFKQYLDYSRNTLVVKPAAINITGVWLTLYDTCGDGLCSEAEAWATAHQWYYYVGGAYCPADCPDMTVCPGSDVHHPSSKTPGFPLFDMVTYMGVPQVHSHGHQLCSVAAI